MPELYTDFAIPETTTRFVKVEGVNLRQNPNNGNSYRMAFAELEIYEVTTNLLPIISLQPEDITVQAGDTASFAVTAEEGCTYQWQRLEGDAWINLDGAVESTLVLPAHLTESGTQFRCIVTGVGGTIESQEATLTVTPREMTVEASVDGEKVESVIVQQYFTVTVRSDANVKNVRILNENGLSMGRKDYQVTTDQNGTVITMQMNIGTVGDGRSLSIFVQTEEGGAYVDSGVKLTLDVMSVAPQVLSVQAPDTMVVNRASDVVAVTSQEAEKVTIYNEYGLPVITVRNYQDTEDGRAFVIPLKVGTAGTRQFTVVAVNRYGAESQAAPFGPITVRYF